MKDQVRGSARTRRQHEREFKEDLIAQSLVPGASVAAIAMKGSVNANLLFKWRREHVRAKPEADPGRRLRIVALALAAATVSAWPRDGIGSPGYGASRLPARPFGLPYMPPEERPGVPRL